jgi:hypothetical protein
MGAKINRCGQTFIKNDIVNLNMGEVKLMKKDTKNMANKDVFVEITNKEVWSKLNDIERYLTTFGEKNQEDHTQIIRRQDLTNGKVKRATYLATLSIGTFITIAIAVILRVI